MEYVLIVNLLSLRRQLHEVWLNSKGEGGGISI